MSPLLRRRGVAASRVLREPRPRTALRDDSSARRYFFSMGFSADAQPLRASSSAGPFC